MTIWAAFEAMAVRCAGRPAVEVQRADALEVWTYAELHAAAVTVAATLAADGVATGDRCALLADNDAQWCATYLGILKIGAVAVPLDTNYGPPQVRAILADAGPRVLFAGRRLEAVARDALVDLPGIRLAPLEPGGRARPDDRPVSLPAAAAPADHDSHSPAVILYTSDPKGVVLSHANLLAERDAAFAVVAVSEQDSVLGVLPLFHALAQLANLLLPFAAGARVVFLESVSSAELVRALGERRITIFACVPQFFYLIHQRILAEVSRGGPTARVGFRALLAASFRLRRLGFNLGPYLFRRVHALLGAQMRLFVTGGSKFDPAVGRDLYALGFTILQAYGLTETSGAATLNRPDEAHLDSVGRALPGVELSLVPSDDVSVDGEIAVRGPIVMQGYFNRPAATAEVLRDGWLLTGDLGRLDGEGRLTITGRRKEMIVLPSGKNVYPEEVEAVYQQSPFVKEVCVMGVTRDDQPTSEHLFAIVVPDMEVLRARRIANAGDLVRFEIEGLSVHLPPHQRALGYDVWFEPLPRTTTGKLRRHEIARLFRAKRESAAAEDAAADDDALWPEDPVTRGALEVIVRRARRRPVRPDANLELDLGLDSMERVELLAELEQRFGRRVPEEQAHHILTASQLVAAVRPHGSGEQADSPARETAPSWSALLGDLPPASDATLGPLLEQRPLAAAAFFALLRTLRLVLPRVSVSGLDRLPAQGPYILAPNHQSYLDPLFVCGVLPRRVLAQLFFVGAAEYFDTPLTAWLARQVNLVPVDPDANLVPAMRAGAFGLRHGKILVLFPEGERSIDGSVKRFKKGAAILARHLGVPVVPVAIRGVFEIWPRNRGFNWRMLRPGAHRVRIEIGTPMAIDGAASDADAASLLRDRVASMWADLGESPEPPTDHHRTRDAGGGPGAAD